MKQNKKQNKHWLGEAISLIFNPFYRIYSGTISGVRYFLGYKSVKKQKSLKLRFGSESNYSKNRLLTSEEIDTSALFNPSEIGITKRNLRQKIDQFEKLYKETLEESKNEQKELNSQGKTVSMLQSVLEEFLEEGPNKKDFKERVKEKFSVLEQFGISVEDLQKSFFIIFALGEDLLPVFFEESDEEQEKLSEYNQEEKEFNNILDSEEDEEEEEKEEEEKEEEEENNEEGENDEENSLGFKGPALVAFGTDLTKLASEGKIDECFGREKELLEMMEILVRRQKNNPVLVGEAGVGKTAIVELFARRIVNNLVPFVLQGRRVISIDLGRLVAGARYRGDFELRVQKVLDEAMKEPNVIIFIDEIHNLGNTGTAEGSMDAANMLKPVLSRSGFQCIGATTHKEYEKIEKDPALNRRFQPIRVNEPSVEDTIQILYNLRPNLEAFHNVTITSGALRSAAELSSRYIYDRFLPDKAIDLVDRAAAKEVIKATSIEQQSLLSALVNSALTKISNLKMEAFRQGDIHTQFTFQEIENAYKNFLICWVEKPTEVPDLPKRRLSPLSSTLFDAIQLIVLQKADDLMFSSYKNRKRISYELESNILSGKKNSQNFQNIILEIKNEEQKTVLSLYRISLLLFKSTLISQKNKFQSKKKQKIKKILSLLKIKPYALFFKFKLIKLNFNPLEKDYDFLKIDAQTIKKEIEGLSEFDEKSLKLFTAFSKKLRPILQKTLVENLVKDSHIYLNGTERAMIDALIGNVSEKNQNKFFAALDNSHFLKMARTNKDLSNLKGKVGINEISNLIANITGIPLQTLSNQESERLLNLENILHQRVIGQDEAISAIAKAIRRSRLGIQNPNRPIASFFFCGPTGVGKTEVCKALAAHMFGSESDMIRFDMSEFMEKFTISRLIGSPPGYVGYEEGGQLTDGVRKKPYSVVLFDEIEKAHPDVLNILLQILEDGRLTDSQKRLVPFDNTVIIMTSNAGADEIQQVIRNQKTKAITTSADTLKSDLDHKLIEEKNSFKENQEVEKARKVEEYIRQLEGPIDENYFDHLGKRIEVFFDGSFKDFEISQNRRILNGENNTEDNEGKSNEEISKDLKSIVLERLSTIFLPEFLNRLDDIIIFQPLKREELKEICEIMVKQVTKRLKEKQITLEVDESVKRKLTNEGYNPIFGARPLRRLITKYIEDLISEKLLRGKSFANSNSIRISLDEDGNIIAK